MRNLCAEDSISYKYVDYREADGRVSVRSHYGAVAHDLNPDTRLKLTAVLDTIAGATPTGQPPTVANGDVPTSHVSDRRKGWSAELARQFSRVNATVGFANSRESDYVSNGWSLNTLADFNQKNTTLLLGYAGTADDVKVFFQPDWLKKRSSDLIAGITQLIDPRTSITANVAYGRATGYLADPYRVVEQRTEIVPGVFLPLTYGENRPDRREKWTLFLAVNHAVPALSGAIEASYRGYTDTFGTDAHTLEASWLQKLGDRFVLQPSVRVYQQSAADFYRIDVSGATFTPTGRPAPAGPFYSADYRLSAMRTYNVGMKAIWSITPWCRVDVAIERYEMRGTDGVTSSHVYPTAIITSAGAQLTW